MTNSQTFTGIIDVTKGGLGFVAHEQFEEDVRIEHELLGSALHGDGVEVLMLPRAKDERPKGKVLKVLSRKRTSFVGTLNRENKQWFVEVQDPRVYTPIVLNEIPEDAHTELKVLVELTRWNDQDQYPEGAVVEVIGRAGEHETEIRAIALSKGFRSSFHHQLEQEAQKLLEKRDVTEEELKTREDLRDVPTCTIDPTDAKDFDDALSLRKLSNGNLEIGIHIADVTHYVEPGSKIDIEAQERGTSVYLVDRTIPMLPEVLSNDLCSLNPNEDKRAFSAIFEFNDKHEVVSHRFAKTLIRSDKRFTYQEAQTLLDTPTTDIKESPLYKGLSLIEELRTLYAVSLTLRKERIKKGAIEFETDEIGFELDENMRPVRAFVKERLETMKMIEEFMLLANRYVATHIAEHSKGPDPLKQALVYRVHDAPNPDKIGELKIFLRAIGHDHLETGQRQIESKDIAKLMRDIKGHPEEQVVQTATLRSMAKAVYSHKNVGHFSLGFKHYTHFTSPIRRYPDMMVHRVLAAHLNGSHIPAKELKRYRQLAMQSSEREVEAVQAERDSVKFKQVEYMVDRVGKTFEGSVTGVTKNGLFVAENATKAEGFVRAADIPGGWYELDEKTYSLVERKSGGSYRIGDAVNIKLIEVRLEDRELDWALV